MSENHGTPTEETSPPIDMSPGDDFLPGGQSAPINLAPYELGAPITITPPTPAPPPLPSQPHTNDEHTNGVNGTSVAQASSSSSSRPVSTGSDIISSARLDVPSTGSSSHSKRRSITQPHPPPLRGSSLSSPSSPMIDNPVDPDVVPKPRSRPSASHSPRVVSFSLPGSEGVEMKDMLTSAEAEAESQPTDENTLLNLPPPLPFNLGVENLWVGVPERSKVFSWLPKKLRKAEQSDGRRKWILQGVECECNSGEVLAILGGSGSGKTTLLNAIAHRLSGLPVEDGEVAYFAASQASTRRHGVGAASVGQSPVLGGDDPASHGRKLSKSEVKKRIGFVRQQDHLVECLTVRETLTYAAKLRLPPSLSDETVSLIVEQTIDELGLRDAAETVVGGPLRKGISGGEKRRLSIGCVLVTLPSVLILDEPTSGLDAFTSYLLLLTLSQLSRRGRTVIVSIHAPRSDAFEVFDRIALLTKGEIVYSGRRKDCLGWFHSLGHDVEQGVNPLDFLIDVSSVDNRSAENEEISKARVKTLVDAWNARDPENWAIGLDKEAMLHSSSTDLLALSNDHADEKTDHTPSQTIPHRQHSGNAELERILTGSTMAEAKDERRPGWWRQTKVLTVRAHKNVYRNVPQLVGFAIQAIMLGVIIGLTYLDLPETPTGIQSLKNLSFQLIPGVFYLQQVFWIYKFCTDLIIFDREREDNLYDVVPYVFSDWLSFLIPSILSPTIYVICVYLIANLWHDDRAARLFIMVASTVLVQFCCQGLSLFAATLTRSFAAASMIGNFLNLMQIMSSGFILTHVPAYGAWIRWVSPYFYSFRIVITTQFKDRTFACPQDSSANLAQCTGNNVLNGLGVDYNVNIGAWFGGLIGLAIFQYALSSLILSVYVAGGVKHASEIDSHNRGKTADVTNSHMTRDRIDVEMRHLSLSWERRGRGAVKSKKKTILDDVSVKFPAGEVSAILGPSGAGKSTLLQLLAGRKLPAGPMAGFYRSGDLLFAGRPADATSRSNVAFVEQEDDWHLPSLTVRETLRYAAILRLPDKMPRRQKIARAETVLLMLGLKDCADLPVGGQLLKGISGGEKRRLSLAVQMINDPAVLVVDEPTSGLDSSIALSVMQVLRDIAATGRTVIATIHQPRSDIWRLADNVTLLAKGGVVTFTGKRFEAVPYFTSIGHPMPSEFFNPADHLLDLVSVDPRKSNHEASVRRVKALTESWHDHLGKTDVREDSPEAAGDGSSAVGKGPVMSRGEGTTSMRIALPVVLERHWKNLWRNKEIFFNRLVQTPLLGGMFILFFQRLTKGPSGAQDRIGITIQSTGSIAFVGLLNAMAIFPADRNLYFHESKSSARYSPATFVITYTVVELGFEILGAMGYAAIMNVAVGMQTSARIFFEFGFSIWALVNMGESMAMIFGSWISIEGLTVTIVSTLLSLVGQVSGVISLSVPDWLAGIAWGFTAKSAAKVQIINESVGLTFDCTPEQVQSGVCVAQNGEQLLALFGWHDLNTARYMGIMVAVAVAWRVVAWISIAMRVGGFR